MSEYLTAACVIAVVLAIWVPFGLWVLKLGKTAKGSNTYNPTSTDIAIGSAIITGRFGKR